MIRDAKYQAKLPFRARGHAELVDRVGGIFADIDERLEHRERVRVLELGCGFGTVLLELLERYGARAEVHGINREHNDGNIDIFRRNGLERGLIAPDAPLDHPMPAITYTDVAEGLPFADGHFDIIYSQVAWRYFGNKIGVLREVSRVLRDDGLAKLDAEELRPGIPSEYQRLIEIWDQGLLVPLGTYLARFGMAFVASVEGEFLPFVKSPDFGVDLELVQQIDLSRINARWDGIKCVYRLVPPT
ncbi:MAG: class I SAM-dependent methyltransferase [Betaproteobacteria bacterium]